MHKYCEDKDCIGGGSQITFKFIVYSFEVGKITNYYITMLYYIAVNLY